MLKKLTLLMTVSLLCINCLGGGASESGEGAIPQPNGNLGVEFLPDGERNTDMYGMWKIAYAAESSSCDEIGVGEASTSERDYDVILSDAGCDLESLNGSDTVSYDCAEAEGQLAWNIFTEQSLDNCELAAYEYSSLSYDAAQDQIGGSFELILQASSGCGLSYTECRVQGSVALTRYVADTGSTSSGSSSDGSTTSGSTTGGSTTGGSTTGGSSTGSSSTGGETSTSTQVKLTSASKLSGQIKVNFSVSNHEGEDIDYKVVSVVKRDFSSTHGLSRGCTGAMLCEETEVTTGTLVDGGSKSQSVTIDFPKNSTGTTPAGEYSVKLRLVKINSDGTRRVLDVSSSKTVKY